MKRILTGLFFIVFNFSYSQTNSCCNDAFYLNHIYYVTANLDNMVDSHKFIGDRKVKKEIKTNLDYIYNSFVNYYFVLPDNFTPQSNRFECIDTVYVSPFSAIRKADLHTQLAINKEYICVEIFMNVGIMGFRSYDSPTHGKLMGTGIYILISKVDNKIVSASKIHYN